MGCGSSLSFVSNDVCFPPKYDDKIKIKTSSSSDIKLLSACSDSGQFGSTLPLLFHTLNIDQLNPLPLVGVRQISIKDTVWQRVQGSWHRSSPIAGLSVPWSTYIFLEPVGWVVVLNLV